VLNDRVLPFFERHGIPLVRILTDRGTECWGSPGHHQYALYLAVENFDHTRTKGKSPQTNGVCKRCHRMLLAEFYCLTFCKKSYERLEELQRCRCVGVGVQRTSSTSGPVVLWEDADASVPG